MMTPILKIRVTTTVDFRPRFLRVRVRPRYWEDCKVNGVIDEDGALIPLRAGEWWCPLIDLETGQIVGWPSGTTAKVYYKVCDDGEYWLEDAVGKRAKYRDEYVPAILGCDYDCGSDYIAMTIGVDGKISNWKPDLDEEDWYFEVTP